MKSSIEIECEDYDSKNKWKSAFENFKKSSASSDTNFSTKAATNSKNIDKNRYKDVLPYDHSRVILSGHNDYINASYVEVPEANRKYILTQGPLENTISDFWQMCWEQGSMAIVMLNKVVEKDTVKCSQYWPLSSDYNYGQVMFFEDKKLQVTLTGEHNYQHFTVRTLQLEKIGENSNNKRDVLHFHFMTWPDFGVPSSPNVFLCFLHTIRQTRSLDADVGPIIVHCSAGIGRSGTFCLVDSCLVKVENSRNLDCININESLTKLRSYRMGLIQTADQLRFSYLAIIEGAKAILKGNGLQSLEAASSSINKSNNNAELQPPDPPERTSSLQRSTSLFSNIHNTSTGGNGEPPLKPPRKSPSSPLPDSVSLKEKGDIKADEEKRAADLKQKIREDRKKQTMEMIRQMKEKQRKSERWRQFRPYIHYSMYYGIAFFAAVTAFLAYKYLL